MTFTQAQAESLYAQVLDIQAALVLRGELHSTHAHQVADGVLCKDGVSTLIECTCGRGMIAADADSQAVYALHVADALGLKVRFGRAA